MRRRKFIQSLVVAPAVPAIAQQTAAPAPAVPQGSVPIGLGGAFRGGQPIAALATTTADVVAQPAAPTFFSTVQFANLRKLGGLLVPPMAGHPGALEAGAPEFLDGLIRVSPADRQKLYRDGLDGLEALAKKQYGKSFAELEGAQADAILHPLMTVIAWVEDLPKDPERHFIAQAHRDFRTATQNSREWAAAVATSGRRGRGFGGGAGLYWLPIDPVKG
jgi:hypothetical protein